MAAKVRVFISALIAYRREFRRRLRSRGRVVVVGRGVYRARARRAASAVARVYTPRVCGRTPAAGCMNGRPCPVPPPPPPHRYAQRVHTHTRSFVRAPARSSTHADHKVSPPAHLFAVRHGILYGRQRTKRARKEGEPPPTTSPPKDGLVTANAPPRAWDDDDRLGDDPPPTHMSRCPSPCSTCHSDGTRAQRISLKTRACVLRSRLWVYFCCCCCCYCYHRISLSSRVSSRFDRRVGKYAGKYLLRSSTALQFSWRTPKIITQIIIISYYYVLILGSRLTTEARYLSSDIMSIFISPSPVNYNLVVK